MANIIIKGKSVFGNTRSEHEENLRKEWGPTVTDEQLDKIKFLEKRAKDAVGSMNNLFTPIDAEKVR